MNSFDSRFISRERIRTSIDALTSVKDYLRNFPKPLTNLIKEVDSVKGVLKILGFFRVPGSAEVLAKMDLIREYAHVVLRDLYKVKLDKQIGDFYELYLKMDGLNKYIDGLESSSSKLKR